MHSGGTHQPLAGQVDEILFQAVPSALLIELGAVLGRPCWVPPGPEVA